MSRDYSPAERFMILCMTRDRGCTPEQCLKGSCWIGNEERAQLKKAQSEFEAAELENKEK